MEKKEILAISIGCAIILSVLLVSQASALSTRGRVLDGVSVISRDENSEIKVSFKFPVQYVRHFPEKQGKEVRIQLEPIALTREDAREGIQEGESLAPPVNNDAGVTRIQYEGRDMITPTLTIVFSRTTSFEVKQGGDFRSLIVLVPVERKAKTTDDMDKAESTAPIVAVPGTLTPQRQANLIKEGEEAVGQENYPRAIQIYTKLTESSDPDVKEFAQFQLALARENNGHLAHAIAEYKNYLRIYPEGPNAEAANDHLKALLRGKPLKETAPEASPWQNEIFGSISQYYDFDESFSDEDEDDEETVNISLLTTYFDATWRMFGENFQVESLIIGSYEYDLLDDDDNESRMSSLYMDVEDSARTITTRWGRQSANTGGILGRFDGGRFSYLLTEKLRLNLVGGFPVERSSDGLETDRYFYGFNFDLGQFADHWDFNVYFIDQIADGVADRRAIGVETRYVDSRGSFFTLLDYDIIYNEVNILLLSGNWFVTNSTWLNFSADFRNSPVLSTSNALIGQNIQTLSALDETLGEDRLQQLAEDRTLDSSFVTLGASHTLTEDLQIAGDISWSKLDGGPASSGVEEVESTGNEFFYTAQLTGNNLIKDGDISTFGLRYGDMKLRDIYSLTLNTRYPINDMWRMNPKLQVDYRVNKRVSDDQWRFIPSLKVEYGTRSSWQFEVDAGIIYLDKELPGVVEDPFGYFMTMGLRYNF